MDIKDIKWLGHASFRIDGIKTIYIDPFNISTSPKKADIILVTHSHYDHFSLEDIKKIQDINTLLIAPEDCKIKWDIKKRISLKPGETIDIEEIKISTIPAYNINKNFHPKENNWVGYIINIEGFKIYHAGDTDAIKEMENLDVDVALLPIGGTYTMDADQAASISKKIKAKIIIPMHYGNIIGTEKDAMKLKESTPANVLILHK